MCVVGARCAGEVRKQKQSIDARLNDAIKSGDPEAIDKFHEERDKLQKDYRITTENIKREEARGHLDAANDLKEQRKMTIARAKKEEAKKQANGGAATTLPNHEEMEDRPDLPSPFESERKTTTNAQGDRMVESPFTPGHTYNAGPESNTSAEAMVESPFTPGYSYHPVQEDKPEDAPSEPSKPAQAPAEPSPEVQSGPVRYDPSNAPSMPYNESGISRMTAAGQAPAPVHGNPTPRGGSVAGQAPAPVSAPKKRGFFSGRKNRSAPLPPPPPQRTSNFGSPSTSSSSVAPQPRMHATGNHSNVVSASSGPAGGYRSNVSNPRGNFVSKSQADAHWSNWGNRNGDMISHEDGSVEYSANGALHRIGAPALVHANGTKEHWEFGQRSNYTGPAVIHSDGRLEYWKDGIQVNPF